MALKFALIVAASLAVTPAIADGLPIFTADGEQVGHIVQSGLHDDHGYVAEISQPLGLGAKRLAVPKDAIETRDDHAVLRTSLETLEKISVPLENESEPDP